MNVCWQLCEPMEEQIKAALFASSEIFGDLSNKLPQHLYNLTNCQV